MSKSTQALIIDDDAYNLEVIWRLLGLDGISCTRIQDVQDLDAVLATNHRYDVVFLDLEMPHLDGFEVFQKLRATLGANVPIVACTVHLSEVANTRDLGFSSFISKPLDHAKFPDQVKRILAGEQVWEF